MNTHDFRYLMPAQKAILAAGGWRPGDSAAGAINHSRPSKPCIEGLIRRGFLHACAQGEAYVVPSDIAAAFRDARRRLAERRMEQDERRAA